MSTTEILAGVEDKVTTILYGGTELYIGCGAIEKIGEILQKFKAKSVGIVTGRSSYKSCGAWAHVEKALKELGIEYVHYDGISANPTTSCLTAAVELFRPHNVDHIIGIGGGSPIDSAKSIGILLRYPDKTATELYTYQFAAEEAVPVIAINTTHGTGTECDRFAVATIDTMERPVKPGVASPAIYPRASIDDPNLCMSMSTEQTVWTTIDAMNHAMEAATTIMTNPFGVTLAHEVWVCAAKHLQTAIDTPTDRTARYYLHYASAMGGAAFDSCLLHITHALEVQLSAMKPEIAHGLGLAMIQPSVIKRVYPAVPKQMAYVLGPVVPGLKGEASEAETAAKRYEEWLRSVSVTQKLLDVGFTDDDVDDMVTGVYATPGLPGMLLNVAIKVDEEVVRDIFRESLHPLSKQGMTATE